MAVVQEQYFPGDVWAGINPEKYQAEFAVADAIRARLAAGEDVSLAEMAKLETTADKLNRQEREDLAHKDDIGICH